MSLHLERNFETEICEHLGSHGWLYDQEDAQQYDRARSLFPIDVLAWVQSTQPQAWETLTKSHGDKAGETLLTRLRDQLDQRGTLDVLRHGIELLGLEAAAEAGAVQTGAGHQSRHPCPLRRQSSARGPAGANIPCTTRTALTSCCSSTAFR